MPNPDSPYGGYIHVRPDGSVIWQVEAREFASDRDADGALEYAIRVVDAERTILASRDGKCLVNVHPQGTSFNARLSTATAKFLIVSGYTEPETPDDAVLLGKSYYVTGNSPAPGAANQQRNWNWTQAAPHVLASLQLPPYDLILRYDDYDLDRANLPLDLEPDALSLCYQHWVSVRRIWRHYVAKPTLLADSLARVPAQVTPFMQHYDVDEMELRWLLVWSLTYHHLVALGIAQSRLDALHVALENWSDEDDDIWLSRWRRVRRPGEDPVPGNHPTAQPADAHWSPSQPRLALAGVETPLAEKVRAVDGCFGYRIEPADLSAQDEGGDISGRAILCEARSEIRGSRTITVTGLTLPGTFGLMYHRAEH